jgi:hypothetical protein
MNYRKCILFILSIFFFYFSCKKKYPQETIASTPVFYFKGSVNNAPVNIEAGENDYYMYASYKNDSGLYKFIGTLTKTKSNLNSIQIQINNYTSTTAFVIDSAMYSRYYSIEVPGGSPNRYVVNFLAKISPNDSNTTVWWDFGDGTYSNSINPKHTYFKSGNYVVALETKKNNGCVSKATQPIKLYNPTVFPFVNIVGATNIYLGDSTNLQASFFSACSNMSYSWSTGDTGVATKVKPMASTSYSIKANCVGSNVNDSATIQINVLPSNQLCKSNIDYMIDASAMNNTLSLSNVTINWTDASGTVYTSKNLAQPKNSYFKIIAVEGYANNEMGQSTKKLFIQFSCTVFNGASSISLSNAEAVIAVAYK